MSAVLCLGMKKKNILYVLGIFFVLFITIGKFNLFNIQSFGLYRFFHSLAASRFIFTFVSGIILSLFFSKQEIRSTKFKKMLWIIVQILFLGMLLFKYNSFFSLIICTLFFISWLLYDRIWMKKRAQANKILSYLGDISFSIYLMHLLIIQILINICMITNVYVVLPLSLLLTICISHFTYKFVEKPCINYARKITNR